MWRYLQRSTERVRGRWVISWQAYTIGVALHIALVGGTGGSLGAEPTPVQQSPYWLLMALVASALVGCYALVVNYTVFRHKRSFAVPLWQAIAFHIGVGVIFASVLLVGSRQLPVTPIVGPVGFTIATVSIGVWFGFTMSFILQAREQYHLDRSELIEMTVRTELATIAETEAMAAMTATFAEDLAVSLARLEPIRIELADRLEQTRTAPAPITVDASWQAVAHRLRSASEQSVRPLSHELWHMTEDRYPSPTWRELLLDTLRSPIGWPWPTALIVIIGYMRGSMSAFGIAVGLLVTVALAAIIAGLLWATSTIKGETVRGSVFWLVFLVAQALGLTLVFADAGDGTGGIATEVFGSVVAMSVSVFAPASVRTLNGARARVLSRLRTDAAHEQITQIARGRHLARLAREAAAHLHGTVQTSLVACAAAIDLAAESNDPEALAVALERAMAIVSTAGVATTEVDETLQLAVERTVNAWQGLVDIDVRVDSAAAEAEGPAAAAVARVIEECIANAVRHGDAMHIRIQVEHRDSDLIVVVADDGRGFESSSSRPGLGTSVLIEASAGRTSMELLHPGSDRPGVRVTCVVTSAVDDHAPGSTHHQA